VTLLQAEKAGEMGDTEFLRLAAEETEFKRVKERLTLKHKNTSQWARRALRRGINVMDEGVPSISCLFMQMGTHPSCILLVECTHLCTMASRAWTNDRSPFLEELCALHCIAELFRWRKSHSTSWCLLCPVLRYGDVNELLCLMLYLHACCMSNSSYDVGTSHEGLFGTPHIQQV